MKFARKVRMNRWGLAICAALLSGVLEAQSTMTFQTTQIQVDTGTIQVLTADFNADGNADLVFLSRQTLTVLLGNGDGTFQAAIQTPAAEYSSMAVGDFDNDGRIDVVLLGGGFPKPTFIDTYLGRGDGAFSLPLRSPVTGLFPAAPYTPIPQTADMNGDGNLDLVSQGLIVFGAGDGTFARSITTSWPAPCGIYLGHSSESAVADFNGDGNPDLALVNTQFLGDLAFGYQIDYGSACFSNGNGTFTTSSVNFYSHQSRFYTSYWIVTGDFNGDGNSDVLLMSQFQRNGVLGAQSSSVIFGNGDGTFLPAVSTNNFSRSKPVVTDFNGDGKSDLVQMAGAAGIAIFLSNGDGTFNGIAAISAGQNPVSIAVADFNNDGLPDIVSTGVSQAGILINTTQATAAASRP